MVTAANADSQRLRGAVAATLLLSPVQLAVLVLLQIGMPSQARSQSAAQPEAEKAQSTALPTPTGAFAIGRRSLALVDRLRPETMTTDPNDRREVLLNIWYPAEGSDRSSSAPYLDIDPQNPIFQTEYRRLGPQRLLGVRTHATTDAPVARAQREYPVILFSHGLRTVSALYSTFLEELASHGYIVVGVESPYFSSAVRFPDGRIVGNRSRRPPDRLGASAAEQQQLLSIREQEAIIQAQDLVFVLSELERLKRTEGNFWTRLDLRHAGVFGHSRGAFSATHACRLDLRFKACMNLDGYRLTEDVMRNGIAQPLMYIQEQFPWEPPATPEQLVEARQTPQQAHQATVQAAREWDATFRRMHSTAYVVTVTGAVHMSFSDAPYIAPDLYQNVGIDARTALTVTRAYILAFFDEYLKGVRQPLLRTHPPFPEVTLEVMEPGQEASAVFRPR